MRTSMASMPRPTVIASSTVVARRVGLQPTLDQANGEQVWRAPDTHVAAVTERWSSR